MRKIKSNCWLEIKKAEMDSKDRRKILVRDLNEVITCRLCEGYLVDATALTECFHVFCRACILRHFENSKTGCPICNTIYKRKSQTCFRADPQTQTLVYKLVPSLFARESQRREDFYRSTGVRASSSCSDDSVIERERDMMNDQEEILSNYFGDKFQFLSPDDSVSLSLEYYQSHLDTTDTEEPEKSVLNNSECSKPTNNSENSGSVNIDSKLENSDSVKNGDQDLCKTDQDSKCDKRFLQCPAAVSMKHLQKFIRMKFGLTGDHRVDIIYKGEVLNLDFTLMDVAYTFKWRREHPMRFFYRIFTPLKIRPIKIVNTPLLGGGKQLQIVPVKSNVEKQIPSPPREDKTEKPEVKTNFLEETEDQKNHKERLFAHLQLQSKSQAEKDSKKVPEKSQPKDCVFEYEEPDQEEIKRFAEIRDREWAKKLDEERRKRQVEDYSVHHFSKKRKKSKHSKNEFNTHKKRKLHAEIAPNQEDHLKLKVKITNNGHKHKYHKSSTQFNEREKTHSTELSSKEKLLQMRQVRHKHVSSEDKNIQTVPSIILASTSRTEEKVKSDTDKPQEPTTSAPKITEDIKKVKIKVTEPSSKVSESATLPKQPSEPASTSPKVGTFLESSSSKTGFTIKNTGEREWGKKVPTVHLERNEQTEKQAFLKAFHAYAEKYQNEKNQQIKLKNAKLSQAKAENNKITTNNKSLNLKLANLQQRCTIEPKQPEKIEKKMLSHYPPGFTVSKVEQGLKRKNDESDSINDKRPSLEITLINPPSGSPIQITPKPIDKPQVKRPPPATIPLEKIKKSVSLKSGISIIPKMPDRCDNIGALDLSNKSPESSPRNSPKVDATNGISITTNRQLNALVRPTEKPSVALANLQMLSKVATEHPIVSNKPTPNHVTNKPRPQMPNLQTLKIPNLQSPIQMKTPNLQKLPKLNEIQKFRPTAQVRSVRPNQNQNIRNIPNPSLLINRQQNQNRLGIGNSTSDPLKVPNSSTIVTSTTASTSKDSSSTSAVKTLDSKIQEKKEISV
ncbi:protein suppressor 2 of zeste-like [Diabrotica virgifera virgifera]|uniref:Protein suppressor 2 of zeste-like n=1 Tax=Diabrotica virgifera virgifera TaxID=50390 RepID=A0A6P7FPL6_DIAVI|nr:protein suppressor 2 of zeste-like [Diabrotica virgifera virgifera]